MLTFARRSVGLDIGNSGIRIVELMQKKDDIAINGLTYCPLTPGVLDHGVIVDKLELVAQLNQAFANAGIKRRKVRTVLTGQNLVVRRVTLPKMPVKEIAPALELQIEQYLPFSRENVVIDFNVVSASEDTMDVMVFGAERKPVVDLLNVLGDAGISVEVLDVNPCAVWRSGMLCVSETAYDHLVDVYIDFGADTTKVSVFVEGLLQLHRIINIGGNVLTNTIMQSQDLSYTQAEAWKQENGLTYHFAAGDKMLEIRNKLFEEIWRSLRYVLSHNKGVQLRRILMFGGGSNLPGLDSQLQRFLQIQLEDFGHQQDLELVHVDNPLALLSYTEANHNQQTFPNSTFAIAVGVALGGVTAYGNADKSAAAEPSA